MLKAGFEDKQTAKPAFVLYGRSGPEPVSIGMCVLHVDDACFAGEGPLWSQALDYFQKQAYHRQKKHIVRMRLIPICAYPARVWHDHVIVALIGGVFYLSDCTRPLRHGKGKRSNACMAIYFLRPASG